MEDASYATKIQEMYKRLLEIGICPNDLEGVFQLERTNQVVDCDWFRSSHDRCDEHIEGKLHCRSVCANSYNKGQCMKVTFPPVVSPPLCQDEKKKLSLDGKKRTCKYVARRPNLCYEKQFVRDHCLVSCKEACTCYDFVGAFNYGGRRRTCGYVRKNKIKRCRKWKLNAYCPETCGMCTRPET